ncbi:AbrB/MazE/SpoVT family DNA-binding domain-containing protein [Candidatus Roizmanbacteria bacterium CG_4_8_14_3_um_filter_34_9]|uniref:AbrB/MazE/SpoVT family DNA-binding domain-containing protein n=3 Tax=Candidatus Roizmaniibacteriota TaxID=1752723 RepID=A0A2M7AUS7_9BACT|nr:MAG: AbrB/MazE/SpoVT family DNA-binding domain-containing protein [Candidatus Roizmanbacteria bacterium CG07_land_8_20_14_0_80_34_15]PIU74362.1 MAG: AbrB/MazE/SpoVT family DNA-binding domain-containing protein [Candidatus Roizmanbacteria bacterium CG06_land_8_20_14_3_00_34_14]PIW73525.1 MAG: AbrB/MazE/SpoVT family DNA-binding domain-containing protein [Candidatus Roizmanbacteria bacterium CG_4_8_14_3_um_filter_34_9]
MIYTATVTSQGQITIPIEIRRKLKLDKNRKIVIKFENNAIFMEAEPDIFALEGIFKDRALKNKSIDEIIKIEKDAVADAVAERYRIKMKKMGITVPK